MWVQVGKKYFLINVYLKYVYLKSVYLQSVQNSFKLTNSPQIISIHFLLVRAIRVTF